MIPTDVPASEMSGAVTTGANTAGASQAFGGGADWHDGHADHHRRAASQSEDVPNDDGRP
jgi:hypothetical protein